MQRNKSKTPEKPARLSLEQLVQEFLAGRDVRPASRNTYRLALAQSFKWWGKDMKKLQRKDVIAYKEYLLSSRSENTADLYLTVVRSFFEYAESKGACENIAAGIRVKNKNKMHRKEHLEISEVNILLESIGRDTVIGKRDYAIINLMLRSGMRCIEVSRLRVCDISCCDNTHSMLIQRKGENSRNHVIGLTGKAAGPVMEYLKAKGYGSRDEPVFTTHKGGGMTATRIGRIVKARLVKAGINSRMKTAHSLRHTTAVMAIMNRVPVREVQLLLGHHNIETTETYLKSIDEAMRKASTAIRAIDEMF